MGNDVPCYGCTEREVGCHSKCEKYLKFRSAREASKSAPKAKALTMAEYQRLRQLRMAKRRQKK